MFENLFRSHLLHSPRVIRIPNSYRRVSTSTPPLPKSRKGRLVKWGNRFIFAYLGYAFIYEPLRDRGVFDAIVQPTIFRVLGPKKPGRVPVSEEKEGSVYQPLKKEKEIRLLILEPGKDDEEVRCRLINVELSWRTRYEALSYAWGDASITKPIGCSGHTVDVTTNLHSALRDLRYRKKERILWVDALCINQNDKSEKDKQVQLMGSIYSGARRVLIYLGKMEEDVENAFDQLQKLDKHFTGLYVQRYCSRITALGPWTAHLNAMIPSPKQVPQKFDWQPVIHLLQRPWFERTWIVQEAVLAKRATVICGDQSMPWLKFERVINGVGIYHETVRLIPAFNNIIPAMRGMNMIRAVRRDRYRDIISRPMGRNEYSKYLDLLFESTSFQCSNPRDKIFGFLGIARDAVQNEYLKVDYTSTVENVFKNFVIWDIHTNNSLRSLSCSSNRKASVLSLPSWVPDFTQLNEGLAFTRWENRMKFNASRNISMDASLAGNGTMLLLKGILIDPVHTVSKTRSGDVLDLPLLLPNTPERRLTFADETKPWRHLWESKKEWAMEIIHIFIDAYDRRQLSFYPRYPLQALTENLKPVCLIAAHPGWEQFWRALTCNHTSNIQKAPHSYKHWVEAYLELATEGVARDDQFMAKWLSTARLVEQGIKVFASSRRFVGTERGLIGWAPINTRKGDVICVFYGSTVPHVLRPVGKGFYKLVGECYIEGIMNGEAIGAKDVVEKEFVLI